MTNNLINRFNSYNNIKYLMGTHIIESRPEIGIPDCISGDYSIIDTFEGLNKWKDKSKEEFLKENSYTIGMIYNKLLILYCGTIYCAQDIKNLENIDSSIFHDKEINADIDEYYIYYFTGDYVYHKDILFLILPYLEKDLITSQPNFISYQVIKKNKIYKHIKLE